MCTGLEQSSVPVIHSETLKVCDEDLGVSPSVSVALVTTGNEPSAFHTSRLSLAPPTAAGQFTSIVGLDDITLANGSCSSSALEWLWLARDDDDEGYLLQKN